MSRDLIARLTEAVDDLLALTVSDDYREMAMLTNEDPAVGRANAVVEEARRFLKERAS